MWLRTPSADLPLVAAEQAQKHVIVNEALQALDAIVHLSANDRDLATPPVSPADGDRYIIGASPTGAWSGQAGRIAVWQSGAWEFRTPKEGWLAWVADEDTLLVHDGTGWIPISEAIQELQNLPLFGLGTAADATNPFSAKLNKALWTAKTAAEGGDGDLRYTLNKEAAADVLSLLLQRGFSGRAEIGLIGDDDLTIKVSADGSTWTEALVVDKTTGAATLRSLLKFNESVDHAFGLQSRPDAGLAFPVPTLRPEKSNALLAFDLMPRGTPSESTYGKVWIDICDADLIADATAAVRCAHVGIKSSGARFGSQVYNGGASTPIELIVDGVVEATLAAGGKLTHKGQLQFPATQNPSADPNCLDDYEEGTFTPVLSFSGSAPTGLAYAAQAGRYTKIGDRILVEAQVLLSSKGAGGAGHVRMSLPFTVGSPYPPAAVFASNVALPSGYSQFTGLFFQATSLVYLYRMGNNVAGVPCTWDDLTNSSNIVISGHFN